MTLSKTYLRVVKSNGKVYKSEDMITKLIRDINSKWVDRSNIRVKRKQLLRKRELPLFVPFILVFYQTVVHDLKVFCLIDYRTLALSSSCKKTLFFVENVMFDNFPLLRYVRKITIEVRVLKSKLFSRVIFTKGYTVDETLKAVIKDS